jgi:tetratricopeptide (TPR) repeat protein
MGEAEKAIALAPYFAPSHFVVAETLNECGKPDKAIEIAKTAMRLDPMEGDLYEGQIGLAYFNKRRFKEAVPVLTKFLNAYPGIVGFRPVLVVSYIELGMMEQARAQVAEILRRSPKYSLEKGIFKGAPRSDPFIADLRKAGLK